MEFNQFWDKEMLQRSMRYLKDAHDQKNRLAVFKNGSLIAFNIHDRRDAKAIAENEAIKLRGVKQYFQIRRYKNGGSPIQASKNIWEMFDDGIQTQFHWYVYQTDIIGDLS